MILVSYYLLVNDISVEGVEVFLVPELSMAEYNLGSDDCKDEDDARDDCYPH